MLVGGFANFPRVPGRATEVLWSRIDAFCLSLADRRWRRLIWLSKMVRCIRGALYDVILDLRKGSSTFGESYGAELTADNRRMMYVPKGFAHGFITLVEDTEALYLVDEFYSPENERGIRYDDPKFRLQWPAAPTIISDRDKGHPSFDPIWHLGQS
jgi:dTDP-4-dehydrorhamnose 3,5-epimerase